MNVLIITAHPETNSFNSHLASRAAETLKKKGAFIKSINLYSENFEPREGKFFNTDRQRLQSFDALREQRYHWEKHILPYDVTR